MIQLKLMDVRAVGRCRTEEEKARRHIYGDKGAKFSKGKIMSVLGCVSGCLTRLPTKDNLVCEVYEERTDIVMSVPKGSTGRSWYFEQAVYLKDGLARSLKSGGGSGNIPKVIE